MFAQFRISLVMFVLLTLLTGVAYPIVITSLGIILFKHQAGGSLIEADGHLVGSELIGQPFDDPRYFWSRPSATGPVAYNPAASSGSNLGPTNPALAEAVTGRVATLKAADPDNAAECRSTWSPLRPAGSIRTSAPRPPSISRDAWPGSAAWIPRPWRNWSPRTRRIAHWVFWAKAG